MEINKHMIYLPGVLFFYFFYLASILCISSINYGMVKDGKLCMDALRRDLFIQSY